MSARIVASIRDHPRSRGEYRTGGASVCVGLGSSPLSRGIQACMGPTHAAQGIIPALAGNTYPQGRLASRGRDHPRSRGEYLDGMVYTDQAKGSSPLSRGIRAAAGVSGPVGGDHPRSRGEYVATELEKTNELGSSPLSRGIRVQREKRTLRRGSSPLSRGIPMMFMS